MTTIENPVLPGFNPDPSLLRVGNDYYIATSTFEWFPGVCIHHSKDLMNWEIVSYALTDEKVFNLMGIDTSCGVWAPNLTYDHGVFYLIYTIVYTDRHRFKDTHNFLVTSADVRGTWSEPIHLNRTGFDPSLFHDPDGTKWLVNMIFDYRLDETRFGGVAVQQYDPDHQTLIGSVSNVFRGSEAGTTEGPNIFYHNGYYYLMTAEGGTAFNHCATLCRAKKITGPYELCPYNPILTSWGKPDARLKRAGHGQIIEDGHSGWYMAHLCSRTLDDCSVMGRETSIQNMTVTEDGWFRVTGSSDASPLDCFEVPWDAECKLAKSGFVDFSKGEIPRDYMTLRQSKETCGIRLEEGTLKISGGNSLASRYNQALLARRQQDSSYDFTTRMEFQPTTYCHMAGITCYYNYDNYYYFFVSRDGGGNRYVEVLSSENKKLTESTRQIIHDEKSLIVLKAEVRERELQFSYSLDGKEYCCVGQALDMRILSDEHIEGNGFTGAMVGVCCQDLSGDGEAACFEWMDYEAK